MENFRNLSLAAIALVLMTVYGAEARKKNPGTVKAKTTVATAEEDHYDVSYVKIDLSATNLSTAISGSSTTKARVVNAAGLSEYYFELSNQLTIDSAFFNGQPATVLSVAPFVNKIELASSLPANSAFEVTVYYHGAPTGGTGFFTNGILNGSSGTPPVQVTHTVSAAYHSRDWFPCKQSLTDKIDSADVWITVPTGLKVAGNGLLKDVTSVDAARNRFEWSTRYPVDYYLLSFAVAPYTEYNYFMHFTGSNDSMLVQNYIYDDPAILLNHQDELDSIALMINHFSALFGKYPYHEEKVGVCLAPLGGGMENQTMVSVGSLDATLIAHELSHQWWGNHVTCATIKDMWLNEGWATYCEHLFLEEFRGASAAFTFRNTVFNQVMANVGGTVEVSDTANELRVYDGRLTYYKGAAVAHMLRFYINDDSVFFPMLRDYHDTYAFGNASTADLMTLANQASGMALDTFFKQWIYKEGYPTYTAKWAQSGSQVVVKLSHTTSKPTSVPLFKMPLEIKLKSPQGDTVIRIYNDQSGQLYSFTWNRPMNGLQIDPDNHIVNKQGAITNDPTLDVPETGKLRPAVYPNPTRDAWYLRHIPAGSTVRLQDMSGRTLKTFYSDTDTLVVPAADMAAGNYILTISHRNDPPVSLHLSKN